MSTEYHGVAIIAKRKQLSKYDPAKVYENGRSLFAYSNTVAGLTVSWKMGDGVTPYGDLKELLSRTNDYANIAERDAETELTNLKFAFVVDASADSYATAPYAFYYRHNNNWYLIPGSSGSVPPDSSFTYTLPFTLS